MGLVGGLDFPASIRQVGAVINHFRLLISRPKST